MWMHYSTANLAPNAGSKGTMVYDLTPFIKNLRSRGRRLNDPAGISVQAWSPTLGRALWKVERAEVTETTRDWPTAALKSTGSDAKLSSARSFESTGGATTPGSWGSTRRGASSEPSGGPGHHRGDGSSRDSVRAREDYFSASAGKVHESFGSPARQASELRHLLADNAQLKRQLHEDESEFARRDEEEAMLRQSLEQLSSERDEARRLLGVCQKRIDEGHGSVQANAKLANDAMAQLREEKRQHREAKQQIEVLKALVEETQGHAQLDIDRL